MKEYIRKDEVIDLLHSSLDRDTVTEYIYEFKGFWMDESLDDIAEKVETKMRYMCNCENCITTVKEIITGEKSTTKTFCDECIMRTNCEAYNLSDGGSKDINMGLEELKKHADKLGYSLVKKQPHIKLEQCKCGRKRIDKWVVSGSKSGYVYKCACGLKAEVGKTKREARENWNKMILGEE